MNKEFCEFDCLNARTRFLCVRPFQIGEKMRLNKYIASAGIASRRKADELIKNGNVKINGKAMSELGYDVKDGDKVEVNGRRIDSGEVCKKKVYYLLNKPEGYVTTMDDEFDRPTVKELVKDIDARVFPVGRLDFNTSGLIIMTNDGDFAYKLTHPKHEIYKKYLVLVAGKVSYAKLAKLRNGVDIGGFVTSKAIVKIVKDSAKSTLLEVSIHEGKNRQIRKMFKAVGNPVQQLKRIAIGDVQMGRLREGYYRKLRPDEVARLV